jgi:hypothetical protein
VRGKLAAPPYPKTWKAVSQGVRVDVMSRRVPALCIRMRNLVLLGDQEGPSSPGRIIDFSHDAVEGIIYVLSHRGEVAAYGLEDKELRWTSELPHALEVRELHPLLFRPALRPFEMRLGCSATGCP